jgi:hypothetical protein
MSHQPGKGKGKVGGRGSMLRGEIRKFGDVTLTTTSEIPLKALRPWLLPGDFGRLTLGQAGILPLWITDHHGVVIRMPVREPHRLPDRGGSL